MLNLDYTWFGLDNSDGCPWRPAVDKIISPSALTALTRGRARRSCITMRRCPKIALVSISSDSTHKCPGVNSRGVLQLLSEFQGHYPDRHDDRHLRTLRRYFEKKPREAVPAVKSLSIEGPGFDANQTARAFVLLAISIMSIAEAGSAAAGAGPISSH